MTADEAKKEQEAYVGLEWHLAPPNNSKDQMGKDNTHSDMPPFLVFHDFDTGTEVMIRTTDIQSFQAIEGGTLIHCRNGTDYRVKQPNRGVMKMMRMNFTATPE